MAKIKFNARRAADAAAQSIKNAINDKNVEEAMGQVIVDRIAFEARKGTPLNDTRSFPPLKESTIRRKEKLARKNKKHPAYRPGYSNLTFTGQLIDSLSFRRVRDLVFEVFVDDTQRRPISGAIGEERKTNEQVDNELRAGVGNPPRKFQLFTADGVEKERKIIDRIREIIKAELRRRL